jgi:hypothetical protein
LAAKLVVAPTVPPGWLAVSLTASIIGILGVTPVHAGAVPVHAGSPPPVAVAVLVAVVAVAATFTGTVITIGLVAPIAIEQPVNVLPVAGQPVMVPPVAVGTALNVMPVGKASANVVTAVVGPLAMAIVMVYVWPTLPTTNGV